MENAEIVKWLGIIIVIVMAVSMLAAAFLYGPGSNTSGTTPVDSNYQAPSTEFTYSASFDTTTITELSALRIRATTSEIEKEKVDTAVKSISGVSKISSKFITSQNGSWDYFADIYLTRSTNTTDTGNAILALSVFSENPQEKTAVKYMTLSSPGKVSLRNTDLNITRDFNFDGTTLTALVDLSTQIQDNINVQGTIKLAGKDVTFIELIESTNNTAAPKNYSFQSDLPISELKDNVFLEADRNFDTYFDSSLVQKEIQALDANTQVYIYPTSSNITINSDVNFSNDLLTEVELLQGINSVEKTKTGLTITFDLNEVNSIATKLPMTIGKEDFSAEIIFPISKIMAQTTTAQVSAIEAILAKNKFSNKFMQEATFDVNTLRIPDLGKELPISGTLAGSVKLNHKTGDVVTLNITAAVSRETIVQIFGEEK